MDFRSLVWGSNGRWAVQRVQCGRNTISIGLKEMINRVLQLNISQLENSFNSHLEKHFVLDLPSQPNSLNPLEIERGNL